MTAKHNLDYETESALRRDYLDDVWRVMEKIPEGMAQDHLATGLSHYAKEAALLGPGAREDD